MIALDTNILIYAHRADSPWYGAASELLRELAEGLAPWAIPWPCVHEFLAVVTHPRIFRPPTPLARAAEQVEAWAGSPSLTFLAETGRYWRTLYDLLAAGRVAGPQVHDARVAALCLHHGVRELWTADRDFGRFPRLATRNPLVGARGED